MSKRFSCPILAVALTLQLGSTTQAQQASHWAEGFDGRVLGIPNTLVAHDPGTGPELYAFGGNSPTSALGLRFDGVAWSFLPVSPSSVTSCAEFDLGGGALLVAATGSPSVLQFSNGTWTTIGTAFQILAIPAVTTAVIAWDDGSGTDVYVAGSFASIGAVPANNIARWDGTAWSALDVGLDGAVGSLAVYDDGNGPALYAAGSFANAGGTSAPGVARWRNGAWSPLLGVGSGTYKALQAFDDGAGIKLYAGGTFPVGATASSLATWDGSTWTSVAVPAQVTALAVHDDGGGPALFAGYKAVGQTLGGLLRLRNGNWTTLPITDVVSIQRMVTFQGRLWIAVTTTFASASGNSDIQAWDGTRFRNAFSGNGMHGEVRGARVLDIGNGPRLLAVGPFRRAGRTTALCLASFDGTTWSNLGDGPGWYPNALEAWNDGTGTKLYAAGNWGMTPGLITSWNGSSWSGLGSGLGDVMGEQVFALHAFDDGTGPQLYVGGVFQTAGGIPVANIARWNGATWSAVGSGFGQGGFGTDQVSAFAVFDEGAGPRLFAGGYFSNSGGTSTFGVARWNGTSWTAVGNGIQGLGSYGVEALCVHDDGTGPKLYAAGWFGLPAGNVARWDGASWSAVGAGLPPVVTSLSVHDDGTGPSLYAGRSASFAGQPPAGVYRWNGASWSAIPGTPGSRVGERIAALASYDDPSSEPAALYAFGSFVGTETISSCVAKWSRETEDVLVCLGDGSGTTCPCGNASASAQAAGCLNSLGLAGTLRTSGAASLTVDTLALLGTSMTNNGAALYFQGTTAVGLGAGATFGDGLRCAGGTVRRLATVANAAGASQLPDFAHPAPISTAGAIPVGGATRVYQAWYRNAAAFCTPDTWNLTNGVRITWRP